MIQKTYIDPVAHIENDFLTKENIPRQSGIEKSMESRIVFEPEYNMPEAVQGIEEYKYIWLIWQFSENLSKGWNALVHPFHSADGVYKGVFAARTPFRPNSLGLSCVELVRIESNREGGKVLIVKGADLMNGTPIFDIKPYIPADCKSENIIK